MQHERGGRAPSMDSRQGSRTSNCRWIRELVATWVPPLFRNDYPRARSGGMSIYWYLETKTPHKRA
jgi:hypothetical protein